MIKLETKKKTPKHKPCFFSYTRSICFIGSFFLSVTRIFNSAIDSIGLVDDSIDWTITSFNSEHDGFFSPPPDQIKPFKFYVYDNLDEEFLPYNISRCIENKLGDDVLCDWGLQVCEMDDVKTANLVYVRHRNNYNADAVQADLFLRYPYNSSGLSTNFATRTPNPNEADIWVVPYPSDSHCKCAARSSAPSCTHGDRDSVMDLFLDRLFQKLNYYNSTTMKRHLFLSGSNFVNPHPRLRDMPLRTTKGGAMNCRREVMDNRTICGTIVAPTHKSQPDYQPTAMKGRPEEWWTQRPRTHSLVGVFGRLSNNKGNYRHQVLDRKEELFNSTIGGMPVHIYESLSTKKQIGDGDFGRYRTVTNERALLDLYINSTFCIILPGDMPPGNRVYDTIMSGCIPVFLLFRRDEYPYWFRLDRYIVANRVVYPFARGIFLDDAGIDYESMVVQIDMECGLECIKPTLEKLMANPSEITRLRMNLRKYAALFSYGLEQNSFQTFDAFGVLLWQLGNYVHRLSIQERLS